ncbi:MULTISPECIES: glutamine--fructose-6-phosphate transaminase (isomerizing) [Burkholderia]|uniref:Glutamine--fructose-6-phosphate aminotransferase [isomerizing] n=1 Tax=Burkholderia savannae TaxID=1637837 RepID=A0ABR5T2N8_9BURK|nr:MULTISPECIES: glutamine--fructose-6-phosphate transaminase (isomerizing) [Burkholderia]AOJ72861.1 glutamine--fructose-6-phosphate aminotransferase [Burkholderia savannae]AOK49169.1 glutamine--fructose-6-phosphate aminotransferase [Burkholderia sp. MSMB617WGS]KVG44908.1 glutamine--fructose-6-phosphate aminotransferase [Burkholderia sp. MSMB0265]KVG89895.1 glutamine--fructose-6-phosphate aminotransferase [Burkholderia sp. MSMB2040]KVG96033.1 glutamine--fructose-6-phosphate aminotransferase [B
MCGIVGAVAQRNIVPILIEGLRRLEYRGYDSCGVATLVDGEARRERSVSRVADLEAHVRTAGLTGSTGIAHTRWATHGAPATCNAHPIFSRDHIALVHNGIIENHEALRTQLSEQLYEFDGQTDTEVVAHLIHSKYRGDLLSAVRDATSQLRGAYAIAVFSKTEPNRLIGARVGSPLVVGLKDGECFLASDALALAGITDQFIFLDEGDIVELTPGGVRIVDRSGAPVERTVQTVPSTQGAVELGDYRHFMQKEIFEQPHAVAATIPDAGLFDPAVFGHDARRAFEQIDNVLILACGTSHYAGLTARRWLETIARLPAQVEIASEYRYSDAVAMPNTLIVVVSQSGETADTLAALKYAQALGHIDTLAICNVPTSAMMRQTGLRFLTRAGPEIGVASTKAFTTQLVALFILAVTLGRMRGRVDDAQLARYTQQLRRLPGALEDVLALELEVARWADEFARHENALFLGRGLHYPIALEGALKLKEISYIHAEAYPAGELKHGPLALVTNTMPVATIAPNDALLEKLKSNMQEVRARGGQLYVFADADTRIDNRDGISVMRMPDYYGLLSPILHVVPLQLLAYHAACIRGADIDKPRNLAKSVTVE